MKIKDINLKNDIILAPMAGYSDIGFRHICKKFGVALTVTEMISARALMFDSEKTKLLLETDELETPKAVQIFGNDPEVMAKAVKNPLLKDFDIIDINMGCPAPKIVKNGEGSALMKNPDLAEKIIKACVSASDKPVTVKFRLGWDDDSINAVEFAKMCERAGASLITVHGRTRAQFYTGTANYKEIKKVVDAVNIPVVANGDVVDKASYSKIKKETGCDGVMIGRGAVGNPWMFLDILGVKYKKNNLETIKEHYDLLEKSRGKRYTLVNMRKHILAYLKGEENASDIKRKAVRMETKEEVMNLLEEYFKG